MKYAYLHRSLIAASSILLSSVSAATISWSSSPYRVEGLSGDQLNTGVFNKSGTLLLAENSGGAATIFDGINFDAGKTTFSGGNIGVFHHREDSPHLSTFGTYGELGSSDTVTLSGLTIGHTYRIQALVYDGRTEIGIPGRTVSFDGVDQGQYANGIANISWGSGLLVTGTFIADDVKQDFTIETFAGSRSMGGQLNALLLHNTTTAANSASLLSIGGVTLSLQNQ